MNIRSVIITDALRIAAAQYDSNARFASEAGVPWLAAQFRKQAKEVRAAADAIELEDVKVLHIHD